VPDRGSFELSTEDVAGDIRIVALSGDADRFRAEEVTRAIQAAGDQVRAVIVDMTRTTFMDSSMLATLVAASEEAREATRRLVLVVEARRLRRSLEVKGLTGILTVVDSREHALELLAGGGDESPGESVPEPA
jgi:anti-sigma B factor antagonist